MILPDTNKALHIIWELNHEMRAGRNDGWTCSGMKESLWKIKMAVDEALVDAPEFADEESYEDMYLIKRLQGKV